jgi:Ni/Co efflux regulator RcnB
MKSTAIVSAVVAATMGFSSMSFAQGFDRREGREARQEARQDVREARRDVREARRDLRDNRNDRRFDDRGGRHFQARSHQYQRGGYAPQEYRSHRYAVHDWNRYHLSAPPHGHQWVQSDNGDFLLIALATGLIANLLLNQ